MKIEVTVNQEELDEMGIDSLELEHAILEDIHYAGYSATEYSGFDVSVTVLE